MKKYLFIIVAGALSVLTSCKGKNEGGMSETAKKNLEANHAINKMFESGDLSKLGDYIAADGVDHSGMNGTPVVGLDSIKAEFASMMKMMGSMKVEVIKELADDDYVISWSKNSWTMKEDGMGMKAGESSSMESVDVSKFKDGKATDHWSFMSYGDVMKMMSASAAATNTNMGNKTDSTGK